jgi:hypothetical protein
MFGWCGLLTLLALVISGRWMREPRGRHLGYSEVPVFRPSDS